MLRLAGRLGAPLRRESGLALVVVRRSIASSYDARAAPGQVITLVQQHCSGGSPGSEGDDLHRRPGLPSSELVHQAIAECGNKPQRVIDGEVANRHGRPGDKGASVS